MAHGPRTQTIYKHRTNRIINHMDYQLSISNHNQQKQRDNAVISHMVYIKDCANYQLDDSKLRLNRI